MPCNTNAKRAQQLHAGCGAALVCVPGREEEEEEEPTGLEVPEKMRSRVGGTGSFGPR